METTEHRWIWVLCAIAAFRVFTFSAAFPFFNNVDEQQHFDLVEKYSDGRIPKTLGTFSPESAHLIALYSSPEYFSKPEQFRDGHIPQPLWQLPPEVAAPVYERGRVNRQNYINHEATSAPLYYAVAGAWLHFGKLIGLAEISLLYWIRFMNVFAAVALVWLGFAAAQLVFPEQSRLRFGTALLLAVWPQDTFYSIQSDVFSPLCFGAAFIYLVKWMRANAPDVRHGMALGGCLAATYLNKTGNVPLLSVSMTAAIFAVLRCGKNSNLKSYMPGLVALVLCAALPLAVWMTWCEIHFGDLTGSAVKIKALGWSYKPFGDWWRHPILSPYGLWIFGSQLLVSFWRGEFVWAQERLASPVMDGFYVFSSVLFVGYATLNLTREAVVSRQQAPRHALWLALSCVVASVIFLALMSVVFDFGDSFYPSREYPYFTSGRLITGAMIPFALLYVDGMDRALRWVRSENVRLLVLIGIAILITASEVAINSVAFSSNYNWFAR